VGGRTRIEIDIDQRREAAASVLASTRTDGGELALEFTAIGRPHAVGQWRPRCRGPSASITVPRELVEIPLLQTAPPAEQTRRSSAGQNARTRCAVAWKPIAARPSMVCQEPTSPAGHVTPEALAESSAATAALSKASAPPYHTCPVGRNHQPTVFTAQQPIDYAGRVRLSAQ